MPDTKRLKLALSKAKAIVTWASYYRENYDIYSTNDHKQNLKNIEKYAHEIVKLLKEVIPDADI